MTTTTAETSTKLTIDVWADVLCPWCYIGEERLSQAIDEFEHADDVELKVHTFELDPSAPNHVVPTVEYIANKHGVSQTQARMVEERMQRQATSEGLKFEVDRPAHRTFDMLRLVQLGNEHGVGWDYLRAMQAEVFSGNDDAFEADTLVRVGVGLGLSSDEIRDVLATDRYAEAVRADHAQAVELGANGVPFSVVGKRLGIPGAVSVEQYGAAIRRAWKEQADV